MCIKVFTRPWKRYVFRYGLTTSYYMYNTKLYHVSSHQSIEDVQLGRGILVM